MKGEGKRIIVSPLNWGLGHASRCVPLVRALIQEDFEPILAGDGASLDLLTAEFPGLKSYALPSYGIEYASSPRFFRFKLLSQGLRIQNAVAAENRRVQDIVKKEEVSGIISDNRFGVWSKAVPSVYVTHQLQVKAGFLSGPATFWHQKLISRFDRCWVCDHRGEDSLAGDLSSNERKLKHVDWIGPLSRFSNAGEKVEEKEYDICAVLSGPEPSRTQFEAMLVEEFKERQERIVLVRGVMEDSQVCKTMGNLTVFNYLLSEELERLMRRSELLVMRSGYSSIMDLQALSARAVLVPTPGQDEQEYLARHLKEKGLFPSVKQNEFSWASIEQAQNFEWPETKKHQKALTFQHSLMFSAINLWYTGQPISVK